MPVPVVYWWDITARDAASSQRCYADLFGWHMDRSGPTGECATVQAGAGGIGGGIGQIAKEDEEGFGERLSGSPSTFGCPICAYVSSGR